MGKGRGAKNPPTMSSSYPAFSSRVEKMRGEQGLEGSTAHSPAAAAERGCGAILLAGTSGQGGKMEVVELTGKGSAGLILPNPSSKSIPFVCLFVYDSNTY